MVTHPTCTVQLHNSYTMKIDSRSGRILAKSFRVVQHHSITYAFSDMVWGNVSQPHTV